MKTSIHSLLEANAQKLQSLLEAQILLAYVLGVSRSYLYSWPDRCPDEAACQQYERLILRRQRGEPIAYIVGVKEFWSLPFSVSHEVLIPRPETELIVELVLKYIAKEPMRRVLDLGTGSGAIACALAKEFPRWQIVAVDKSDQALRIATENAKNLALTNVEFYQSDWFSIFSANHTLFDVIVGNPPYISPRDHHLQAPDIQYEPRSALISAPDGLTDLKRIIQESPQFLASNGWLVLEHGFDQSDHVRSLMEEAGLTGICCFKDLAGLGRVTLGRSSGTVSPFDALNLGDH